MWTTEIILWITTNAGVDNFLENVDNYLFSVDNPVDIRFFR